MQQIIQWLKTFMRTPNSLGSTIGELKLLGNYYKITNFHIIPINDLSKYSFEYSKEYNIILYIEHQKVGHFVAIRTNNTEIQFYEPSGCHSHESIIHKTFGKSKKIIKNTKTFQSDKNTNCGFYCLHFLKSNLHLTEYNDYLIKKVAKEVRILHDELNNNRKNIYKN